MDNQKWVLIYPHQTIEITENQYLDLMKALQQGKSHVQIHGGIRSTNFMHLVPYNNYMDGRGYYECKHGIWHKKGEECTCVRYGETIHSGTNSTPLIGDIDTFIRVQPERKKEIMMNGIKRVNPKLYEHMKNGGTYKSYIPRYFRGNKSGWLNGHWKYEDWQKDVYDNNIFEDLSKRKSF